MNGLGEDVAESDAGYCAEHCEQGAEQGADPCHPRQQQRPDEEPEAVTLYEVLDRPGKQEDKAVFQFRSRGREHLLTLGRSDDEWRFESLT